MAITSLDTECQTKYPILLVHGTGFRDDSKLYNYWGRIPKALREKGAKIYYGRQDAWGTIQDNATRLLFEVNKILLETGCDKINIIAHSKGGLESRYLISTLNLGNRVASLTTISTPHHGSRTIDMVCRIPGALISFMAIFVNLYFKIFGDKQANFKDALYEFTSTQCAVFNEKNIDNKNTLYQSYAARMRNAFSDISFFLTYSVVKLIDGENDGLVGIESAKWGNFRGIIENSRLRGVSHSDVIDLWRASLSGFDIRNTYIGIVKELKENGY